MNLKLTWERDGLRIDDQYGKFVGKLDITDISLLDIPYGGNMEIKSDRWPITRREVVEIMLGRRRDIGEYLDKGQAEIATPDAK